MEEIIYVPKEQLPLFQFRKAEKPLEAKGFLLTSSVINNLQPTGNPWLVGLWYVFLCCFVLITAAIDIILFLIIGNLLEALWKIVTDSATGILGKFARIMGIAVAIFVIYVFVSSKAYIQCGQQLRYLLGW